MSAETDLLLMSRQQEHEVALELERREHERTLTIAQMAATLMSSFGSVRAWGAKEYVVCATEIMMEAEASAAKGKELHCSRL